MAAVLLAATSWLDPIGRSLSPDPPTSLGVKRHFSDVTLSRLYGSTERGRDLSRHALNQSFL
jgi:hypothetical protein